MVKWSFIMVKWSFIKVKWSICNEHVNRLVIRVFVDMFMSFSDYCIGHLRFHFNKVKQLFSVYNICLMQLSLCTLF